MTGAGEGTYASGPVFTATPKSTPSAAPGAGQEAKVGGVTHSVSASWSAIGIYAAAVDDLERTRIALGQRAKAFVREGAPADHPDVLLLEGLSKDLEKPEARAIRRLEYGVQHDTPLGPFVKNTPGLGLKTVGRFLGCVGNPRVRPVRGPVPEGERVGPIIGWQPRTVSALWKYCGLDVREGRAPKLAKGTVANWNSVARKRAFCMAEPCIKNMRSAYRPVYDAARIRYANADITDGHKHNRAMRAVMKAIVKDLWIAAGRSSIEREPKSLAPRSPRTKRV